MNRFAVIVAALLAATPLAAQDELIPTHIAGFGEISATLHLRYEMGTGTLSQGPANLDVDTTRGFGVLEGSVGLGMGFEAELSLPYQFEGTSEGGSGGTDIEQTTVGLGDMELRANYRLTDGNLALPQIMAGVILVMPSGADDLGVAEIKTGGVVTVQGEDGGPGQGVAQAGLQVGVSKRIAGAEIYGLVRCVVPTAEQSGDQGGVSTDVKLPDKVAIILGANISVAGAATLDLRLTTDYLTKTVEEDDMGNTTTEDPNINVKLQALIYYNLGGPITFIGGLGAGWVQDHAVDKESDLNLEQQVSYGLELGLHIKLP